MAAIERILKITSDTSGLAKGAADVAKFGQAADSLTARLKAAKASMDPAAYRTYAAAMKPAIEAEKAMAAELRKHEVAAAKATTTLQKRVLSEARAAESLRKQYETGYAASLRYAAVEEQVARQVAARNLTIEQGNAVLSGAAVRFKQMGADAKGANDNIGLAGHQISSLRSQAIDMATMFSGGASPFQIISSQAGQVYEALGSGKGGVSGSMKAIGVGLLSLATPVNIAVAGLAAAAGAAIYFGVQGASKVKPLNEAMETHRKLIDDIAKQYGTAITAQETYTSRATQAFGLCQSAEELRLSARSSLLDNGFAGGGDMTRMGRTDDGGRIYRAARGYEAFEGPLVKLAEGLRSGTDDARKFVDAVSDIANQDPANETIQKLAKELIDLAGPAAAARAQLDALAQAQARLAQERFGDALGDLRKFMPDTRNDRTKIEQAFGVSMSMARTEAQERAAQDARLASLSEIGRQEDVLRQGRALDLREVTARTTAEKAQIAAARERLAMSGQNIDLGEQDARVQHQIALITAQANEAARQAGHDRMRASQDIISGMQVQLNTLNMSTGAAEAYRLKTQMVRDLYREMEDSGGIVTREQMDLIDATAVGVAELSDTLDRITLLMEAA